MARYFVATCDCGWAGGQRAYSAVAERDRLGHVCVALPEARPPTGVRRTRATPHVKEDPLRLEDIARSAAMRYLKTHPFFRFDLDEILSDAYLGVADALTRFDPSKGNQLNTFATHRARGAILDGVRDRSILSRREFAEGQTHESLPTWRKWPLSVEAIKDHLDNTGWDTPDPRALLPFERAETEEFVALLLQGLPERERAVIYWRYWDELTFRQIGARLRRHEVRAFQIHRDAIRKLRRWIEEADSEIRLAG